MTKIVDLTRSWLVFFLAGLLWQCDAGSTTPDTPQPEYVACIADSECGADGQCIKGSCAKSCTTSAECNTISVCGIAPNGSRRCVPICTDHYIPIQGDIPIQGFNDLSTRYACVNGVSTACLRLDDTHCVACGCGPNLVCTDTGCAPKRAVGEACRTDLDCISDNCSSKIGTCRVPVGQPCNQTNCDLCRINADTAYQYCSRACVNSSSCRGGVCINETCFPMCDASCPGECRAFTGNGTGGIYCPCYPCNTL